MISFEPIHKLQKQGAGEAETILLLPVIEVTVGVCNKRIQRRNLELVKEDCGLRTSAESGP
jgi:hypothetical protein